MKKRRRNPVTQIPTEHEKMEWARLAKAAYARRLNSIGHVFSVAAATPRGGEMEPRKFDRLQRIYRAWLIDNELPEHMPNPRGARRRLPRGVRSRAKFERCVRAVKRRRPRGRANPFAVCTVAVRRNRRPDSSRRRFVILAERPGHPQLRYVGGIKFSKRGTAKPFTSRADAVVFATIMRKGFVRALQGWRLLVRAI